MTNKELNQHNKKVGQMLLFVSIPLIIIGIAFAITLII